MAWDCKACTFINDNPLAKHCSICLSDRNQQEVVVIPDSPELLPSHPAKKQRLHPKELENKESTDFYPNGRVMMTKSPGSDGGIDISDIVKPSLQKAVISGFCIDDQWVDSVFPTSARLIIASPKPTSVPREVNQFTVSPSRHYIFPKMPFQYGCMHIKLMILWYPDYLRVVIPSANLVKYDWSLIQNIVFYQDFKKPANGQIAAANEFLGDLMKLLAEMGCPKPVFDDLREFDFSNAIGALVTSVPGNFNKLRDHGLGRLSKVVQQLKLDKSVNNVVAQTSSLGRLNDRWLKQFYASSVGSDQPIQDLSNFSILYPTKHMVYNSNLGPANGGTIHFKSEYWESKTFPKHAIKQCLSKANDLMHSKLLICTSNQLGGGNRLDINVKDNYDGYIYVGSHNATQSAWGNYTVKAPLKLGISNWELGIILPFQWSSDKGMEVPFIYPPADYKSDDVPWSTQDWVKQNVR